MIDKNSIHKQESPFLNRFEKAIVKSEKLLDYNQKVKSRNIFQELRIKEEVESININYDIKNLLINYDEMSIDRLYFYYSKKLQKEEEIKSEIFAKIARTLPQDIIINLDDNHPIKSIYNKRNIFNYNSYINELEKTKINKEKPNIFKFFIIYTFTSIISNIEGIDENNSIIISEIKRENNLIEQINHKIFNKQGKNIYFILHFYQHELNKINFIISTLENNYPKEEIKFIFIVHIKRNMDKSKKDEIYSIPDVNEKVDQIFIDNLNGINKVSLNSISKDGIKNILNNVDLVNKKNEFFKALKIYYNGYINELNFVENYLYKLNKYFEEHEDLVDIIVSKASDLICKTSKNKTKNEKKENIDAFNKIKKEIFYNSYITHNTVDIVSLIINDVIIEKRLRGKIMEILDALETDNFLMTLLTLQKKRNNKEYKSFIYSINFNNIIKKYLNSVTINGIHRKAKFQTNYLIPGFLSFYDIISKFICQNITQKFFKNEKN